MRPLIGPAIALLFASACGGSAAPAAQAPAAATATAAPAATTAASAAGPNIADLLKAGKASTYKVTYTWSITTGGQTTTAQQTWYYKAPNARFDYSLGQAGSFSIFALADGTFVCTSAGGSTFCQKSAGPSAFGQNPAADFALQLQDRPDQFNATFTGTETIAGQQAQCYTVRSLGTTAAGGGDVSSCYSSGGVPLKTSISAQGSSFTMVASAFSTSVTDADFALPGPVR
jgi:outer membrane lipoprotein-sorting protein